MFVRHSADSRTYHSLWLVIEHAINDYGIAELRALERGEDVVLPATVHLVRRRVHDEAESGAMRIAGLVGRDIF